MYMPPKHTHDSNGSSPELLPFFSDSELLNEPQAQYMLVSRTRNVHYDLKGCAGLRITVTLDNMSHARQLEIAAYRRPSWSDWLKDKIAGFFASLRREREAARAISALATMDDRSLNDIGIDRGQIGYAVRNGRAFD